MGFGMGFGIRSLGLEFGSLGFWDWGFVLGFGVWFLGFEIFDFEISILWFCVLDLEF